MSSRSVEEIKYNFYGRGQNVPDPPKSELRYMVRTLLDHVDNLKQELEQIKRQRGEVADIWEGEAK